MDRIKKMREKNRKKKIELHVSKKIKELVKKLENNIENTNIMKDKKDIKFIYDDRFFEILNNQKISKFNKKNQKKLNL